MHLIHIPQCIFLFWMVHYGIKNRWFVEILWLVHYSCWIDHYNDAIMGAIASQITSLTIIYSTVYSSADQRKRESSASLAFVGNSPGTGEFPAQMASNAENVSTWWRHHVLKVLCSALVSLLCAAEALATPQPAWMGIDQLMSYAYIFVSLRTAATTIQ